MTTTVDPATSDLPPSTRLRIWMPIRITLAHGVRGGMERQADTLARGLAARGHELTIVTTAHPDGVTEEDEWNLQTLYIPNTTWRRYQRRWWEASYAALREQHAIAPFDVILSHSAGGLGYLARAGQALGLPSVVILHGSSQGEVITAWRGARSPRGVYRLARLGWRLPTLLARWRRTAPSVSHWIAVSSSVARENGREMGFAPGRVTVIANGVDTARFRPNDEARASSRAELGLAADTPLLAVATRLEAEKGVQVALDALARLTPEFPDAHLLVAGAGSYATDLQAQARRLGLAERVRFLGLVPHAALPDVLAAADIALFPSLCHEAFPLSVVEALAVGLPVVASAVGGVPMAVREGATGSLVPPGDVAALADALRPLLADPARRRALGALARQSAEQQFSVQAMVERTEGVLLRTIDEGRTTIDGSPDGEAQHGRRRPSSMVHRLLSGGRRPSSGQGQP